MLFFTIYVILTITMILAPFSAFPYFFYSIVRSIKHLINSDSFKFEKKYIHIQTIIISILTIIFVYLNTIKIYNDFKNFYSNQIDLMSLSYINRIMLYPYLLSIYYLVLFVFYFVFFLKKGIVSKERSFLQILNIDKNNIQQKEYIKLSRFILSAIFVSIWWNYIVFLMNSLGSMAQH
jgi:hypothetical protein